ncbi:hypothetical protein SAMN02745121_01046 [Nannocystis exedens]|uniref:Uncharacterized protein n=1 Tax=Nannocystis exedens TaxID=54 RepID=A0A1I1U8B2_9BACT|nr:hypothetical protein [Nannocystis exedens]PCC71501.1 hypothetical protein NAEX_04578 [Nannocystis exedens]SFD67027.1 hypothetical protein SAMN02745121_01046 [Nannocystis exedens]
MEPSAYRSLAFLFSLGTLPIACGPKGGGNTTDGTTDPTDGTTDPTGGTTDGTSTTTTTTTGEPTTGPTTGGGSETAGADPACAAYVAYYLKCNADTAGGLEAEAYAYCAMMRMRVGTIFGATCLAAQDALFECLGNSPCDQEGACEDEFSASAQCYPDAGELCVAFAAKQEECYGMPLPSYAAGMCQYYINARAYYDGPPCGSAVEEWYACLLDLPCPEFEMQTGCDELKAAFDLACDNP